MLRPNGEARCPLSGLSQADTILQFTDLHYPPPGDLIRHREARTKLLQWTSQKVKASQITKTELEGQYICICVPTFKFNSNPHSCWASSLFQILLIEIQLWLSLFFVLCWSNNVHWDTSVLFPNINRVNLLRQGHTNDQ